MTVCDAMIRLARSALQLDASSHYALQQFGHLVAFAQQTVQLLHTQLDTHCRTGCSFVGAVQCEESGGLIECGNVRR